VPEDEVGALLGWADTVVLPYREASQSGVAAAALGGRRMLATNVGGLAEQLSGERQALVCQPDAVSLTAGLQRLLYDQPDPSILLRVRILDAKRWRSPYAKRSNSVLISSRQTGDGGHREFVA
jgi:glycosyltransferase involved in cell wall biosynthesis